MPALLHLQQHWCKKLLGKGVDWMRGDNECRANGWCLCKYGLRFGSVGLLAKAVQLLRADLSAFQRLMVVAEHTRVNVDVFFEPKTEYVKMKTAIIGYLYKGDIRNEHKENKRRFFEG